MIRYHDLTEFQEGPQEALYAEIVLTALGEGVWQQYATLGILRALERSRETKAPRVPN